MGILEENDKRRLSVIEVPPFGTNAYVLTCLSSNQSVLVDAPGDTERIHSALRDSRPRFILLTHGHFDHTGALISLKNSLDIPVAAHRDDFTGLPILPDRQLEDGEVLDIGQVRLRALHTPGHTAGSLCFLTDNILLSGDTLFPGGPGRTASAKDFKSIILSLEEKIFVLPDEVRVYPGHGESTVLGMAKEEYAAFSRRAHKKNIHGDVLWLGPQ